MVVCSCTIYSRIWWRTWTHVNSLHLRPTAASMKTTMPSMRSSSTVCRHAAIVCFLLCSSRKLCWQNVAYARSTLKIKVNKNYYADRKTSEKSSEYLHSTNNNKKAQLTQRERATAVHVWRPTANKCKLRKKNYFTAQGHSRPLLSVSIETRVWLPISD